MSTRAPDKAPVPAALARARERLLAHDAPGAAAELEALAALLHTLPPLDAATLAELRAGHEACTAAAEALNASLAERLAQSGASRRAAVAYDAQDAEHRR